MCAYVCMIAKRVCVCECVGVSVCLKDIEIKKCVFELLVRERETFVCVIKQLRVRENVYMYMYSIYVYKCA